MIKAGSLVYSLFIITVVAILCSSFILANYYHNTYLLSLSIKTKQLNYLKCGIDLMRASYRQNEYFFENKQLFVGDSLSVVSISKTPWGAFDLIHCKNSWKDYTIQKNILLGVKPNQKLALYLTDKNNSLSLSGKTILKGDVLLPKAGVKRAYIEGNAFKGNKLVQGEIKESSSSIPQLSLRLIESIESCWQRKNEFFTDSLLSVQELFDQGQFDNSFSNRTVLVTSENDVVLEDLDISNNIVIRSKGTIRVHRNTKLENVLLFAKKIIFEESVEGSLQAFATDTLIIKEHCKFNYPTVFGIIGKKESGTQLLEVKDDSRINGVLFQNREEVATNDLSIIKILNNVEILGVVYCHGKVLLEGSVAGTIYCDNFTLSTSSSIYENHLLDAEIDVSKRNHEFVGPLLLESNVLVPNEIVLELP